ncbi:MAG: phosphoribosylglycinamide formyltransferase [Pseudomonadota bacterium]
MKRIKLGVLVSGGGSNLQSIIDHIEAGNIPASIAVVISNQPEAHGLVRAEKHGIENLLVNHRNFPSRESFDARLVEILREREVDLVVLAGFMRLLSREFLKAFPDRVMNIHPALLPSFPGTHVWGDQIRHGVKFSGCTVHFVDEGMDTGPIIIQAVVPVLDEDDDEALAARILRQEHRIYPQAVKLFAEGRLTVEGRRVKVSPLDRSLENFGLSNPAIG